MGMDNVKKNIILTPFNVLYKISPKMTLEILFLLKLKMPLDLKNPKTYNEKLQWIKLYDRNPLMPKCCDKYTVREYVERKGYSNILNELIWNGFDPEDIPFDDLPEKFVLKVTHGSSFNIICTDKKKIDREEVKRKCRTWLNAKFLPCYGEWFYGIEKPRIIVEKYIESENDLKDYKVFCFNGVPKLIAVYSGRGNESKLCQEVYDLEWNLIHEFTGDFQLPEQLTKKPRDLSLIIDAARVLSKDFKHARIDFFYENNVLYFGEITFTSNAGFAKFSSLEFDRKMGDYLEL